MTDHAAILSALQERLELIENADGETVLKSVVILNRPVTPASMFEFLPDITKFPAAVIVPGKALSENGGLTGILQIHLFLIAENYHTEIPFPETLKIPECVLNVLDTGRTGDFPVLAGAHLLFVESKPESFGNAYPGWNITLNARYA